MILWAAPKRVSTIMAMVLIALTPIAFGQQAQSSSPDQRAGESAGTTQSPAASDSSPTGSPVTVQADRPAQGAAQSSSGVDSSAPEAGSSGDQDAAAKPKANDGDFYGFAYNADPHSSSFANGSLFPNYGTAPLDMSNRVWLFGGQSVSQQANDSLPAPPPPPPGHPAQDATLPNTGFPTWQLQDNQNIDPRIRPNAGLRVPLLAPLYSTTAPDFMDVMPPTRNWSARISIGVFDVNTTVRSSKFNEYRDVRDGPVAGVEAHYRDGNRYLNVVGRNLGRQDGDFNVDGGIAGGYLFSFVYDETPHNYIYDAHSLYRGVGTNVLTIAPAIRADIQNSATPVQEAAKLTSYDNTEAQNVDEGLKRQKIGGDVTLVKLYPFVVKLAVSNESRDGERPWSESFGFNNFVEIPWPVKYDTREVKLTLEWAKPESRFQFIGGYRFSDFEDHYQSVTFDNPLRATDGTTVGAATGRMPLYPSNYYHEAFAQTVIRDLPWDSTLSAYFSGGFMRQNAGLIPFTTNTADTLFEPGKPAMNATDPALLPRATTEASMDTQTAQVRWTAHPSERWRLVTEYRLYKLENNEAPFVIDEFVEEDNTVRAPATPGGTFSNVNLAYTKHDASANLTYELNGNSQVGAEYDYERWNRSFREVAWMNDNVIKVFYDTRTKRWMDVKAWYQRTYRDTATYFAHQYDDVQGNPLEKPQLPYIHKLDEAPYHKDDAQLMTTFILKGSAAVSAHALYGRTNFQQQTFGLINDKHYEFGGDFSYTRGDYFSFFANYNWEKFHSHLRDRTWFPGAPSDPYSVNPGLFSYSNWDGYPKDVMQSAGIGFEWWIMPRRVSLNFQYTFENTNGYQSYDSPLGPPAVDENDFIPTNYSDVDGLRYQTLNPEFNFVLSHELTFALGYDLEQYHINDYNYYGFKYVDNYYPFNITSFEGPPGTPPSGIATFMGGLLPPSYTANVFYFRLRMGL